AFGIFKFNLEGRACVGNRAVPQEPIDAACFRIFQCQVVEKGDYSPFSRLLTFENELISAMSAAGRP
ncbi:MAG TPA: hypothetical protein VIS96_07035, partial [Terrimicrobiaceae bacterium]